MTKCIVSLTLTAILCLGGLTLAGCGTPASTGDPVTTAATTQAIATQAATTATTAVVMDDAAFEAYFAQNPIDAFMDQDARKEGSTADMAAWITDSAAYWALEVPAAYDQLLALTPEGEKAAVEQAKAAYQNAYESDVETLLGEYQPVGGTIDAINRAELVKDYYFAKAKEVYRQIYAYDPQYSYHFSRS